VIRAVARTDIHHPALPPAAQGLQQPTNVPRNRLHRRHKQGLRAAVLLDHDERCPEVPLPAG